MATAISFNDLRGASTRFYYIMETGYIPNVPTYSRLLDAGWNGTSPVTFIIPNGTYCYATARYYYGLTVSGIYPNGIQIRNFGYIVGAGGYGGYGSSLYGYSYANGNDGGHAIGILAHPTYGLPKFYLANSGVIGGGGGGGAGGDQGDYGYGGGGGGGGAGGGAGFNAAQTVWSGGPGGSAGVGSGLGLTDGTTGNFLTGGAGGSGGASGGYGDDRYGGAGGAGGDLGLDGSYGGGRPGSGTPGIAGYCVYRYGSISDFALVTVGKGVYYDNSGTRRILYG